MKLISSQKKRYRPTYAYIFEIRRKVATKKWENIQGVSIEKIKLHLIYGPPYIYLILWNHFEKM